MMARVTKNIWRIINTWPLLALEVCLVVRSLFSENTAGSILLRILMALCILGLCWRAWTNGIHRKKGAKGKLVRSPKKKVFSEICLSLGHGVIFHKFRLS